MVANEFQSSTASGEKEHLKLFVFAGNPDNVGGFKHLRVVSSGDGST